MAAALERLSPDRFDDIVAVMCDAFRDYPVMRFIVGEGHGDYDNRLRQLLAYFVYRRIVSGRTGLRDRRWPDRSLPRRR